MVKLVQKIGTVLFVLAIPTLLITSTIRFAVNDLSLYEYDFDKFNISQSTGLPREQLVDIARTLITYFNSNEELVNVSVYSQRANEHLKDVKGLVQLDYRLQLISLAYVVVFILTGFFWLKFGFWRGLLRRLLWGSVFTVILLAVFGIASLLNFDQVFLAFHLTSFTNDLWMLSPSDYLLLMFPDSFFMAATLFIAGGVIAEAVVIGGASWGLLRIGDKSKSRAGSSGKRGRSRRR